ncbi:MAG: carbohydrate-binding domain-containing protein [Eubacteriales bacterium]
MKQMFIWFVLIVLVGSSMGCAMQTETISSTETIMSSGAEDTNGDTEEVETTTVITIDEQFTTSDYEVGSIADEYSTITLGNGATIAESDVVIVHGDTITITEGGTYYIEGALENGQIIIQADAEDKVQLVLDNVTITNYTSPVIYCVEADKVFITTESNSHNILQATLALSDTEEVNLDATIFARTDLTLNGGGTLVVESIDGNGITSKDDLVFTSGTYEIVADNHGLEANDSIRIAGGTISIHAKGDGMQSEHDEDSALGYLYIAGGTFQIVAEDDGLQSSSLIQIVEGVFSISAGDEAMNAPEEPIITGGTFAIEEN